MGKPDTDTGSWRGGRPAWLYGADGATETMDGAFGTPENLWVKAARREARIRALRLIFIGLAAGIGTYLLLVCQAIAQVITMPPPGEKFKLSVEQYGVMMASMFACRSPVMPKDQLVQMLLQKYGETHESTIYIMPTAVAELFVNRRAGSWTLLRTGPQKQGCVAGAGVAHFRPEEMAL
jgi:hypothetical protein